MTAPPYQDFFDAMGVPTLHSAVEQGALVDVVDADELVQYCALALMRLEPNHPDTQPLVEMMGWRLVNVMSTASKNIDFRDDGSVWLNEEQPIEVTDRALRHWEWILSIMQPREGMAYALVKTAPTGLVDRARLQMAMAGERASEIDQILGSWNAEG